MDRPVYDRTSLFLVFGFQEIIICTRRNDPPDTEHIASKLAEHQIDERSTVIAQDPVRLEFSFFELVKFRSGPIVQT